MASRLVGKVGGYNGDGEMPKSRAKHLQEQSLQMALGAIEIYNKPQFSCREHAFPILMVNAWESLAKAQVLKAHRNDLRCLYVWEESKKRYKRRKNGDYITIGAIDALKKANVPKIVERNVTHLVDIRDCSTHLPRATDGQKMLIYMLGAATLKSYAGLLREWFGVGLGTFDFYILPFGFSYPFATLSAIEVAKEPKHISRILADVASGQDMDEEGHHLVCEISVELTSAKRIVNPPDITAEVVSGGAASFVTRNRHLIDSYPLTYSEALSLVRQRLPMVNQKDVNLFIRENNIKSNPAYSAYSYPSQKAMKRGPTKNTLSIYNRDFVQYCVSSLQEENDRRSSDARESAHS